MRFENVVFQDAVCFKCRACGECCRDQPPDINIKEQQRIEKAGFVNFLEAPADPANRSLRRKKDGSCIFLSEENACKIQNAKPSICRLEPFIITDFDFDTGRIFVELNPLAAKNCKGISSGSMVCVEEFGKAAQSIVKDLLEIVAEKTGLPVNDRKVALITRDLLRRG